MFGVGVGGSYSIGETSQTATVGEKRGSFDLQQQRVACDEQRERGEELVGSACSHGRYVYGDLTTISPTRTGMGMGTGMNLSDLLVEEMFQASQVVFMLFY